jgi:hypothetical protein
MCRGRDVVMTEERRQVLEQEREAAANDPAQIDKEGL